MTRAFPRIFASAAPAGGLAKALAPHWHALLALALFLVAGLAVLDDYGITGDEITRAQRAAGVWAFLAGANDAFASAQEGNILPSNVWIYGPSFELALLFVERSFGIEGSRSAYLSQHLLIHLSFLTGGLFVYLLARRLSGNSLVSLLAMLIFLLHPRLYAHSFFNGKDIPFLVAFVVALYLAHRAFRRDTLLTFVLLGVAAGALINLRVMGLVLFAAIPALRALDFVFASGWAERKRILLTTGAFVWAASLAFFTSLPYLWADPVGRAVDWWTTLSAHPYKPREFFRGALGQSVEFPEYASVWFSITTPPFALLLGLVGAALILFRAVKAPRGALRNTRLRFGLLLAGCFTLPILAVVLLDVNIYHGWRHVYFLWAPFSLLAAWGLHRLAGTLSAQRRRAALYGAAGVGLAATLASMALVHPNQQVYFNALVDRVAPERLRTQYEMDYWRHPMLQALLWLSDNADLLPNKEAPVARTGDALTLENAAFLPDAARARIGVVLSFALVPPVPWESWSRSARALHRVQVYDNTILTLERKDDLRAVYDATRGREPDIAGAYDAYRLDGAVALVMEPCAPSFIENVGATLRVTPVDIGDLPPWREGKREEPRGFGFAHYGAFFDGKCIASLPLPDYPIADFRLVFGPELLDREIAQEAMRRAREDRRLLARSAYDVHLADGELVYIQEQCGPLETEHPFRVSVFPDRADDLPEQWRVRSHQRFWFDFHEHGALLEEGTCVALFPLPDYPIAGIRTGQHTEDGDDLWSAEFSANPVSYAAAYRAVAGSEPLARGAFDVYLLDGDLVYTREPCDQADTEARFFLHVVPERAGDLPEERRESGFDNLDFRFFLNGARLDAKCAARVALPDYPVAGVRTGQFVSAGEIWSAEFAVGG